MENLTIVFLIGIGVIVIMGFIIINNKMRQIKSEIMEAIINNTNSLNKELIDKLSLDGKIGVESMATELKYIQMINSTIEENKYKIGIECFKRLPQSFKLLNMLWEMHLKELDQANSFYDERELINNMKNLLNMFLNNCSMEDIDKVENIEKMLEEYSERNLLKLKDDEKSKFEAIIKMLKINYELLIKDVDNEDVLSALEDIDNRIDKIKLREYPDLNEEYKLISKGLINLFKDKSSNNKEVEEQDKYNLDAINDYKKALGVFNDNKGFFKDKESTIEEIVDIIGKWDNKYLYQTTQAYVSTIFMSIFGKLNNQEQYKITKMMISAKKKGL